MNKCGNEGVELPMTPNLLTMPPSSLTPCGAARAAQNAAGKNIVRIKFNDVVISEFYDVVFVQLKQIA